MINTFFATKFKMGQSFSEEERFPVTFVHLEPISVTKILTLAKDGYWAIQVAIGSKRSKNTTKKLQTISEQKSEIKKTTRPKYIREIKFIDEPKNESEVIIKVGDVITASSVFQIGDRVNVTGISKGKGFAGGVKRHHFHGGSKTHGQADRQRAPGSIGQTTTPGRVLKGKKMAGRMGSDQIMVRNLKIVAIDQEKNKLLISGSLPGTLKSLVRIVKVKETKNVKN